MDATYMELMVRLTLAMVLGGAIGIEREYRAKEAGFRTHFLVALGSALFCVVSQYGFGVDLKDSSRVAAQVFVAAVITTAMVLLGLEVLNYLIPQLGSNTIELSFTAPSIDSVKQLIKSLKQDNVEVHSYELKDRRTSKGEFLEVSMELKAKRGFHTLCMLDYMNDFSDVTISTME